MLGEQPDLWDFVLGSWEDDSVTSRFGPEAEQEPYVRGLKAADHQTGCGRRPIHLTRHDGASGQDRRARPHRRGPPVDRRSVPAAQDRDRATRGHPRVHRLQHLRLRRFHHVADPLHPEPDHGRGIPARLAPRAHPPQVERRHRAGGRSRAGGHGGRPLARQPRLHREPGRGNPDAGRPCRARVDASRACRRGSGSSTTASSRSASSTTSRCSCRAR